jgi:PAS domain S-box-containing protein
MARPLHIVLLEDDPNDALLIRRELKRSGFEPIGERVETEHDFRAQLERKPEIVIADFFQPQFDALRALQLVREVEADIPLVVVTGALGDEAAVQCLKAGAADYLVKDRLARLGQAVLQALDQKQARSDRQRAEQALRDSEARKTAILQSAGDAIITMDEHDLIESINPAAELMFGYPASEIIGQHITRIMPSPRTEPKACSQDSPLIGECKLMIGVGLEATGQRKNGTLFPIERTVNEVQLGHCRIFTGTIRDISARKKAEADLLRRTSELARSNTELEQFAYIASHDLQEPLRTIGSFTQLLARRYSEQLDDTADEFISYIIDGVTRMQTLINDLLDYSRVGIRRTRPQITHFDRIIERVLDNLRTSIAETHAIITHDPLPTLLVDSSQMVSLFQNLISNAIRYRSAAAPTIHVSATLQAQEWLFSIKDNGIGFDPKHAERIFAIFQRLHTREKYPGTGMGLAVCKKIIEGHAGRIWAQSEPGLGSTFFFTIPARENPPS